MRKAALTDHLTQNQTMLFDRIWQYNMLNYIHLHTNYRFASKSHSFPKFIGESTARFLLSRTIVYLNNLGRKPMMSEYRYISVHIDTLA
jgi:hypothetical protein